MVVVATCSAVSELMTVNDAHASCLAVAINDSPSSACQLLSDV